MFIPGETFLNILMLVTYILIALSVVVAFVISIRSHGWLVTIFYPLILLKKILTPPSVKRKRRKEAELRELAMHEEKKKEKERRVQHNAMAIVSRYAYMD